MKKRLLYISSVLVVLIAAFIGTMLYLDSGFSLQINGSKIEKEQYLEVMNSTINEVNQYFYEKAGITLNVNSWTQNIEGEIPYEILAKQTLEKLKHDQVMYDLAKKKGYISDESFQGLKERWENENKLRAEKKKKGEPVYGLSEFTFQLYKEYEMDNFQKQYCSELSNEGMEVSEEERKAYYEENKETLFSQDDDIELEYIKINYLSDEIEENKVSDLKSRMKKIYKALDEKTSLFELAKQDKELAEYVEKQKISSGEAGAYSKMIGDIMDYSAELQKGENTQVMDENGVLYLIRCIDRAEAGPMPIEEVTDHINKSLREQRYEEILLKAAQSSQVDGNMEKLYKFTKKQVIK